MLFSKKKFFSGKFRPNPRQKRKSIFMLPLIFAMFYYTLKKEITQQIFNWRSNRRLFAMFWFDIKMVLPYLGRFAI